MQTCTLTPCHGAGAKRQPALVSPHSAAPEADWRLPPAQGRLARPRQDLSFTSEPGDLDHSGRYRSYKDSSGDQGSNTYYWRDIIKLDALPGDVDSIDDYQPQYQPHYQHQYQHPQYQPQYQYQYQEAQPPYPGPGPGHRDRVVIGGCTHQTPL